MPDNVIDKKKMKAIELILQNPDSIPLIKEKYLTPDVLEYCLSEEPSIFRFIPHPSMAVINIALELDGSNLEFIKKKDRKSLPIECFIRALNSNPKEALPYVPKKYLSEEIKASIFDSNPEVIKENSIKLGEDFLKDRIKENPQNIKYVTDPSEEIKCLALEQDPNIALYFEELTEKMMDIIDEKYPNLKDVLPNYKRKG